MSIRDLFTDGEFVFARVGESCPVPVGKVFVRDTRPGADIVPGVSFRLGFFRVDASLFNRVRRTSWEAPMFRITRSAPSRDGSCVDQVWYVGLSTDTLVFEERVPPVVAVPFVIEGGADLRLAHQVT